MNEKRAWRRSAWPGAIAVSLVANLTLSAEDWPRWRGPRGDGSWQGPKLPEKWPEGGLKQVWSRPIGGGYAGPAVVQGHLFIMDREPSVDPQKHPGKKPPA